MRLDLGLLRSIRNVLMWVAILMDDAMNYIWFYIFNYVLYFIVIMHWFLLFHLIKRNPLFKLLVYVSSDVFCKQQWTTRVYLKSHLDARKCILNVGFLIVFYFLFSNLFSNFNPRKWNNSMKRQFTVVCLKVVVVVAIVHLCIPAYLKLEL